MYSSDLGLSEIKVKKILKDKKTMELIIRWG